MNLKKHLEATRDSRGLFHAANLRALRIYLRDTPTETLLEEISRLQSVELIKTLWEAGLSNELQAVALDRADYLIERGK